MEEEVEPLVIKTEESMTKLLTGVMARRRPATTVTRPGILLGSVTNPLGEEKGVEETEVEEDEKTECSQVL